VNDSIPDDVVWARGVRFHLHAVYACAGIVAFVAFLGVAAVLMAGHLAHDPPVTAGVITLLVAGGAALAGAVIAGIGQLKVLRAAGGDSPLETVRTILYASQRAFIHLPRFALAGWAALLVAYAIWLPAGLGGVVVGGFVGAQAVIALVIVRRRLLSPSRLDRQA